MTLVIDDARQAVHSLRRQPGFCAVVLATLALGLGANVALFSVLRGVVLRPLPYPEPDRLAVLWENDRLRGTNREGVSAPDYLDLVAMTRSFRVLGARARLDRTLAGRGEPARVRSARVSASYLEALAIPPLLGRPFVAADEEPGRDRVVLLGERIWRERFGADPSVLGQTLRLDGEPWTVVGVMPAATAPPGFEEQIYEPLSLGPDDRFRGRHNLLVFGRLAPETALATAQAEVGAVMAQLEQAYPDDNKGRSATVAPLHDEIVRDARPALVALFGAVSLVLLLACANVAHLALARSLARERELAVRASMGATPRHLGRLLFTESLMLGLFAGGLGVGIALGGVRLLRWLAPASLPRLAEVRLDAAVLGFALFASLLTSVLFGLLPAVRAARVEPLLALKQLGRSGGPGGGPLRLRRLLVVAEMGLALVLLIGAGLLLRSFALLTSSDVGFRPQGLLVVEMQLSGPRFQFPSGWPVLDWPAFNTFSVDLLERVQGLPGVESVGLAHAGPTDPGWTTRVIVEGRPAPPPGAQPEAGYRPVSPGYFRTLGVAVRRGRDFEAGDAGGRPLVAVVSEAFVRRHFPGQEPLGQRIRVFGAPREIVGVVGDVRYRGLGAESPPVMYFPLRQAPLSALSLVVRAQGDPLSLVPALRSQVRDVDPDLALFGITTAEGSLAASLAERRFTLLLASCFALVALVLAAVGVYGVLSHLVAERRRDVGVRLALGAPPRTVIRMVLGEGLRLAVVAATIGAAAALGASRLLGSLLYGVSSTDPLIFAAAVPTVVAAALLAGALPARRAIRVDPMATLRAE